MTKKEKTRASSVKKKPDFKVNIELLLSKIPVNLWESVMLNEMIEKEDCSAYINYAFRRDYK